MNEAWRGEFELSLPDVREYRSALWDKISIPDVIFHSSVRNAWESCMLIWLPRRLTGSRRTCWCCWVPAQGFQNYCPQIRRVLPIVKVRHAAPTNHSIQLLVSDGLGFREQRHCKKK